MNLTLITYTFFNLFNAQAYTLDHVINESLKVNGVKELSLAKIEASEAEKVTAQSGMYPKLNFKSLFSKNENIASTNSHYLNLTQSIYKGGKDLVSIDLAKNTIESSKFSNNLENLNIKINAINYFFQVLSSKVDLENLKLLEKQSSDRVREISNRVQIGRSRNQELLSAKAQLSSVKAQLMNAEGTLLEAQKKLADYADLSVSDLPEFSIDQDLPNYSVENFEKNLSKRPDLQTKKLKVDEQKLNIDFYKLSHLPTIDLSSNYYLNNRTGTYRNSNWDIALTLTIPIFEGFNTSSKVQSYVAKNVEAEINYRNTARSLGLELHAKFESYQRFKNQVSAFSEALELSKKNYEESLKDYRLGLTSHLDVLTALNQYLDLKRNAEKNKVSAFLAQKILETSFTEE